MNYSEALEYIHSVEWLGSRPGLSRTEELLEKLGNPEKGMKYIHVAGTNGKGSTCSMCNSVLIEAGYKVGLYTSPYIVRFNERMCINGEPISDEELAQLVEIVKPIADNMVDKPTEFEIITALAFLYFKRHECDVVVLEVGMGGRLDSTNVIESPVVSVITGIAIDHVSVLGKTVPEIAREKAGIIKRSRPVVYGGRDDVAFGELCAKAKASESDIARTNVDLINVTSMDVCGTVFDYSELKNIKLSLCGSYQPENAATVIETIKVLNENGFDISELSLRKGLEKAKWRARFELLAKEPIVIFDGSHNLQGVKAASESISRFFVDEKVIVLMGVLADKEWKSMLDELLPLAKKMYCITPNSPRALDANELAKECLRRNCESVAFDNLDDGVKSAYEEARLSKTPLVILGSLYMYGDVFCSLESIKSR